MYLSYLLSTIKSTGFIMKL
ncbi:hypothetical protein, partial [Escherichia coli]